MWTADGARAEATRSSHNRGTHGTATWACRSARPRWPDSRRDERPNDVVDLGAERRPTVRVSEGQNDENPPVTDVGGDQAGGLPSLHLTVGRCGKCAGF